MDVGECSVNLHGFIIEHPRAMLVVTAILHQGAKCTQLRPSNQQLLGSIAAPIARNIRSEVNIVIPCRVDHAFHCNLESIKSRVLVAHPS